MALTRFKDERKGYDGPVSGALHVITVPTALGTVGTASVKYKIDLPPGMRFRVTDASFRCSSVTGTPVISLGTPANAQAIVANTNVTTNLGTLTVLTASQHIARDAMLIATLTTNGVTNQCRGGVLTIVGHVSTPPDSVLIRTGNRSHF